MLRNVNRVVLGLTGLVLIGAGLAALAGAGDLWRRAGVSPPSGWSWRGPADVVLAREDRTQWRDEGWWWPVVIGVLVVLVLLLLWWLLAQLRRHRLTEVLIDSGDGSGALLRGRALEDVVTAEAESQPGVERAGVTLVGRRTQPRVQAGLLLAPQARPGEAVRTLGEQALEHARVSSGLKSLPAEVRLRSARHGPERVS